MKLLKKILSKIGFCKNNCVTQKQTPIHIWKQSLQILDSLDPNKYNCMMMINGQMVYGYLESTGACIVEGINNHAEGYYSKHSITTDKNITS